MLKILWKRGKIAPEEQFLPLSTIFYYLMIDFYVKTGIRFSLRDKRLFEITEVEITRVDCTFKKRHLGHNRWLGGVKPVLGGVGNVASLLYCTWTDSIKPSLPFPFLWCVLCFQTTFVQNLYWLTDLLLVFNFILFIYLFFCFVLCVIFNALLSQLVFKKALIKNRHFRKCRFLINAFLCT